MNEMKMGMDLQQAPKQESVAKTEKSEDGNFEKKFNNKRAQDIRAELDGLAYDLKEGDVNIDTVKYVVNKLSVELYHMDPDKRADNYTRNAYKALNRIVNNISPAENSEEIASYLKEAIISLDRAK